MSEVLGRWAFLGGIVAAVVLGLFTISEEYTKWLSLALVILGLLVGLLNVTAREATLFLLAAIALLMTATSLGALPHLGGQVTSVADRLKEFIAPAALVVALKAIWDLASEK